MGKRQWCVGKGQWCVGKGQWCTHRGHGTADTLPITCPPPPHSHSLHSAHAHPGLSLQQDGGGARGLTGCSAVKDNLKPTALNAELLYRFKFVTMCSTNGRLVSNGADSNHWARPPRRLQPRPGAHRDMFKTWGRRVAGELCRLGFPMSKLVRSHLPAEYMSDSGVASDSSDSWE